MPAGKQRACSLSTANERSPGPERPIIVFDVNETPLDVGPQPDHIGEDLDVIANQLVERYAATASAS